MPTYRELIQHSQIERFDAQVLLLHLMQKNRAWLIAHDDEEASEAVVAAFSALAARRLEGEPVAYLVGSREFFGREFRVTPSVLIPRPDTELLVELALERAPKNGNIIDLGTGSGCIPITIKLERPDLQVSALDLSGDALLVAQANAHTLQAEVRFLQSDWLKAVAGESFDLIVSNPPYIHCEDDHLNQGDLRFEPTGALTDGHDGLHHLNTIIEQAPAHLKQGAWLLLEHGWDQGEACRDLLQRAGFAEVKTWQDLGQNDRVSGGRWAAP
ncbi:peptide chain release factor N(5)-glutamine methyltransferase [Chitinibacter bivalviorum]|uniref:Release factor glutamine methyltransferase n=1 Tax=Chitinibacter bivalviorum TaxID=2739434 RepID=A0A7H9BKC5_9NEIS|nr:peptide chain release factor N(5)-glutamine methyltransferase [Chitinibacter bivalviorum]QLG89135.1 peptide chain release factor N(5)-glutamine methyltransferase [Chitinibacter bivalviorum]